MAAKKILVVGATGTQGGAVVDHLASGEYGPFEVYGLTRDAGSDAARTLAERGVHVIEGDTTDRDAMAAAVDGMDGVFLVTTFFERGVAEEALQGQTVASAAAEAGVSHLVFSSVADVDADTGLPHFDSKRTIERHIHELGVPATVIRPVSFMQNFEGRPSEGIRNGLLTLPIDEGVELRLVDVDDVGSIVASAFAAPERYVGRTLELTGDALTVEELAGAFGHVLSREVEAIHVPVEETRVAMGDALADTYAWFNRRGYDAEATEQRAETDPQHHLHTFDEYLRANWSVESPTSTQPTRAD